MLALVGVLYASSCLKSARWLIARGRFDAAAKVIETMQRRASRRVFLRPVQRPAVIRIDHETLPYSAVLGDPVYLGRVFLLFAMWFVAYITLYSIGAGFTTILVSLHYPPPEADLIAAVGTFGFVLCAVVAFAYGERMERKAWLPVSAALTVIGGVIVALAGNQVGLSVVARPSSSSASTCGFRLPIVEPPRTFRPEHEPRGSLWSMASATSAAELLIAPLIPHLNALDAMLLVVSLAN